jgi:RHS repeat-associated protein
VTLYGNGEAVAVSYSSGTGGKSVYLGKDVMGSVRTATGDTGAIEDRYEYDAFGQPYAGNLDGMMNLGYTGKPYDTATGMYNYGYRDYRPQAARFTTADPIRDGNNWYAYVNNDPVNWVDPWGLFIVNNTNGPSVNEYQNKNPSKSGGSLGASGELQILSVDGKLNIPTNNNITLPNGLNDSLKTAYQYQTDNKDNTKSTITSKATPLPSGNYQISITVTNTVVNPDTGKVISSNSKTGVIAYAGPGEVGIAGATTGVNPANVNNIANKTINQVNGTNNYNYKVQCTN